MRTWPGLVLILHVVVGGCRSDDSFHCISYASGVSHCWTERKECDKYAAGTGVDCHESALAWCPVRETAFDPGTCGESELLCRQASQGPCKSMKR